MTRVLGAVALYGAAAVLTWIVFAVPETGTAMGAIRDVLCGLGGSCAVFIPVMLGWIATLIAMSAAGKLVSVWRSVIDGVLFLCWFTAFQLFVTETVIRDRMTIHGFANYVDKSYSFGRGGGAIGSLLAWPLYTNLASGAACS